MSFQRVSSSMLRADQEARQKYADTAGLRREEAEKFLQDNKDSGEVMFSVPYGGAVMWVMADGSVVPRVKADAAKNADDVDRESPGGVSIPSNLADAAADRFYINPRLAATVTPGAAPLNKLIGDMPVPCGATVLVAGAGAGKTPLSHYLAAHGRETYSVVRAGEPFAGYTTNQWAIAEGIAKAMVFDCDVVVDSIKDLLAQAGNAMKGGIARNALLDLSAWSILGATLGVTIYVPLNPSSGDEETIRMMTEVARSNATATLSHESGGTWLYSVRRGESAERRTGRFTAPATEAQVREETLSVEARPSRRRSRDLSEVLSGVTARSNLFNLK